MKSNRRKKSLPYSLCVSLLFFRLVLNVLPVGLVGLMMAVMMAALMSSLSSAFNSSSTIFTVDVWLRFRPQVCVDFKLSTILATRRLSI